MIADTLKHAALYASLHEKFDEAFAFLRKATDENLPAGRYELDGDRLYAMVQEYDTKPVAEGVFEGHRRYVDIQYLLAGVERMDVLDSIRGMSTVAYDEEKDLEFFADASPCHRAVVQAGEFAVFYPHDLHKPGLSADGAITPVKKVVVKVKL